MAHQVEEVIEPLTRIVLCPLVQLRLDLEYPGPRLSEVGAWSVPIQGRRFSCLEEVLITGPLRHVAGFPDLRLLRDLRHVARASGDVDPARSASTEDGRVSDASHVHHVPPVGVVPSFAPAALSPAHRSSAGDLRMPIL